MSAQPSIAALPDRQPRFAPPLPVRPRRVAYSAESPSVPYPPALAPYLRRNDPGRHWRMVLAAIFDDMGKTEWPDDKTETAHRFRRLVERRCDDDDAVPLVLALVPLADCMECGRAYLRESGRRRHCSDFCRRKSANPNYGTGPDRRPACAVCDEPLVAPRLLYCSSRCANRAAYLRFLAKGRE